MVIPLVLPLSLPGVEVNAWDIAKSLIVTMLIRIVLGLMFRSHSPRDSPQWAAAILVTTLNFGDTMTLPFVLVASIVLPLILIPTPRVLGKRNSG